MELGRNVLSIKRIRKELSVLWIDPPVFCRPGASPVTTDPYHFEVIIDGPDGSPYAGGTFPVDVVLHKDYPFKPPKLTFKTKVYHPNIDTKGRMFLDVLESNWRPALTIRAVLYSIVSVLYDPLIDHPVRRGVALEYSREPAVFEKKARECTRRYATAPAVSFCPAGDEGDSMTRSSRLQHCDCESSGPSRGSRWRFFNLRPLRVAVTEEEHDLVLSSNAETVESLSRKKTVDTGA